jgi:hypothetical protein
MVIQKRSFARVASTAVALGFIAWGVTEARRDRPTLSASVNHGRPDMDGDGLADAQEAVLNTRSDRADSDLDGYSDLEEQARGSDPRDPEDVPSPQAMHVGTCASVEDGYIAFTSAVYVANSDLDELDVHVGVVHRGRIIEVPPSVFALSRGAILPAREPGDSLAVIEIAFPECIVQRYGQVNLFTVARNYATAIPTTAVGVLPLIDFSGTTVVVEETRQNFTSSNGTPGGVVYRPITTDSQIPSTWSGGQVCWQRTAPVGTDGAMILHEVEAADCKPMDTYCSSTDCGAGVGKTLRLPNPAAIAGG